MDSKPQQMEDLKAFVERWKEWGPKLQAIKDDELRRYNHQQNMQIISDLLEIGQAHRQPRQSSGLFEQQRWLAKLSK